MPWIDAKKSAAEWLKSLDLPADLNGRTIDLHELGLTHASEGNFHLMVLRAAARELRRRGAKIKKSKTA